MNQPLRKIEVDENGEPIITEEMVARLFDDETLGLKKQEAQSSVKHLSNEEWHKLRARAKRDLFFLCFGVLGNTRLSTQLHGDLCTRVKETANVRYHGYLLPRGHFKSTILTIGHSIQTVLPYTKTDAAHDEDTSPLPWPASLGTDCRILIGHETHEGAARFLFAITSHFTSNPVLMGLFPEAVPHIRKNRVNKWELELPRTISGNPEPTIDTLGVGGKSQGRHYNYVKLDDIFGDKARDSQAEADTAKDWFDNIQAFFSTFSRDLLDLIGTRYSYDDLYAHAMDRYGPKMAWYVRKVVENGEPIFPEEFTVDDLAILRKNKKVYTAQYLNDPDEDAAGFEEAWKKYFFWVGINEIATFDGKRQTRINVRDLDIVILIDPGVEKSGGFAVTGMDYLGRVFVLQSMRLELKPPDLIELIFRSVMRWTPRLVAIESDIFAGTYQYWLQTEMAKRGIRFFVQPVYTKKKAKDFRIGGLSTYMSAGEFFYNESQTELDQEINQWGKSKDIHILDALAYGPEVWQKGYQPGTRDEMHGEGGQGLDDRDVQTGYSNIE